jgi:hypothetical protein
VDKHITINLTPHMFAVMSCLSGLGVAVMQDNREAAQGYADLLSKPEVEPTAVEIMDLFYSISLDMTTGSGAPKIEIVS